MPQLQRLHLRCTTPNTQLAFYRDVLGMRSRSDGAIGYADPEMGLVFEPAKSPYTASRDTVYWKIAIAVPDIELACAQLEASGIEVDGPRQALNIGYLAHITDPAGFQIELIDHGFEGRTAPEVSNPALLGGGPHLNLLTLRTHDIQQAERVALDAGMSPVAIMPASEFGFCLYFYAYGDENPPNTDLYSVENRTWVYQRRDTVLEIVHRIKEEPMQRRAPGASGYAGATISGITNPSNENFLQLNTRTSVQGS